MNRLCCWAALAALAATSACGGGSGSGSISSPTTPTTPTTPTPPTTPPTPAGPALGITLAAGDHWEFLWTYEHTSIAPTGSSTVLKTGIFRVTVGAPSDLGGHRAWPLAVTGETSDGWLDYAPAWRVLAVDGADLLGSDDLATWKTVVRESGTWTGGGFFVSFGGAAMQAASGTMSGTYNSVSSLMVSNGQSSGGCVYYPETGGTLCSDQSTTVREAEHYKRGIGPIGYTSYISVTDNGGGFYTANTIQRKLELVGTSLVAADGTTFQPPASREVAPLPGPRTSHGCAALGGKLYVVGGSDGTGALSSALVYDPAADTWSSVASLVAAASPKVVAAQGLLVAFPVLGGVSTFDPATGSWSQRRGTAIPWSDPSYASFHDPQVDWAGVITSDLYGGLGVYAFDPIGGAWWQGTALTGTTDRRWFSAATLGTRAYVTGGYRQYLDSKVASDALFQDLTTGSWYALTSHFSVPRYSHASVGAAGKLFVLGGEDVAHYLRSVESYDPAAGTWTARFPLLRARRHACAAELGGKIYVTGGDVGSSAVLSSVEAYLP